MERSLPAQALQSHYHGIASLSDVFCAGEPRIIGMDNGRVHGLGELFRQGCFPGSTRAVNRHQNAFARGLFLRNHAEDRQQRHPIGSHNPIRLSVRFPIDLLMIGQPALIAYLRDLIQKRRELPFLRNQLTNISHVCPGNANSGWDAKHNLLSAGRQVLQCGAGSSGTRRAESIGPALSITGACSEFPGMYRSLFQAQPANAHAQHA